MFNSTDSISCLGTPSPGFPSKGIMGPLSDDVVKNGSDILQGTLLVNKIMHALCL